MIEMSVSGDDLPGILRGLHSHYFDKREPLKMLVDGDADEVIDEIRWFDGVIDEIRWFDRAMAREISAGLYFDEDGDVWMSISTTSVNCGHKDSEVSPKTVLDALDNCDFSLAAVLGPHGRWFAHNTPERFGLSNGHFGNAFAVAFKGDGFEQLVSRRWLEFGPWKTHWRGEELCLVQFHELDVDSETALKQALPGHKRMGIDDIGGFLRSPYLYSEDITGPYDAKKKLIKIIVPVGAEVPQRKMLDACALRTAGANDAGKRVDSVAFVFMTEADARKHLHELWLRELECRALIDGKEVRLDLDYQPTLDRPEWVNRMNEKESR